MSKLVTMTTLIFALLLAAPLQAAPSTTTVRTPSWPGCVVMDVIQKEVCPMHRRRVVAYAVFSYEADGFTTQTYSKREWPAESARLLRLTKTTLDLQAATEKMKRMEDALATKQPDEVPK